MRALELLAQNEKQKLVLSGPDEVKLQGGIYKVPMIRRAPDGSLQEGEDVLVLLLSLHMTDLLDHTHGLFLADFPAHDITPDLILNETMIMLVSGGAWAQKLLTAAVAVAGTVTVATATIP